MTGIGNGSTGCNLSTSQAVAFRFVTAQHAFAQAQTAFQAALSNMKSGGPDAKAVADKAGQALKAAKAEMDAAQTDALANGKETKSTDKKTDNASSSSSSTDAFNAEAALFNPRHAFKDVTHITSLSDFPAISSTPCGKLSCIRTRRTLPACPCNLHSAFSGLSPKDLHVVKGHLHASRFASKPDEVRRAAKECEMVVNQLVFCSRGGQSGKGNKMGKGSGYAKAAKGRT